MTPLCVSVCVCVCFTLSASLYVFFFVIQQCVMPPFILCVCRRNDGMGRVGRVDGLLQCERSQSYAKV